MQWDLWIGKYRAFFVTDAQDREACEQLFSYDGGRELPKNGQWVACQDTRHSKIIACLVLSDAMDPGQPVADAFAYVETGYLNKLAIISHLSFDSAYLNTPAVPVLLSHSYVTPGTIQFINDWACARLGLYKWGKPETSRSL